MEEKFRLVNLFSVSLGELIEHQVLQSSLSRLVVRKAVQVGAPQPVRRVPNWTLARQTPFFQNFSLFNLHNQHCYLK